MTSALLRELGADLPPGSGPDPGSRRTVPRYRGEPLRSAKVPAHTGGRAVGEKELLHRIRPALRAAGVTRLANITGLDDLGIPVTLAVRPNGATLSNSAGKGLTLAGAFASAAMEALELHHAEEWTLPTETMSCADAFRELGAPPVELLPRTAWGLLPPSWPLDWVRGWDIATDTEAGVPVSVVRMGDRGGRLRTLHAFHITSNGLASSTNLPEAVHSGLLEVIERDALTCWRYRTAALGQPPPVVGTRAFGSAVVDDLVDRLARRDVRILVQDATVDTAVPVYSALLFSELDRARGVHAGFGAHLDPEVAVVRAITEACQSRAVHIAGSRDDVFRHRIVEIADTARDVDALRRMLREADEALDRDTGPAVGGSDAGISFDQDLALLVHRLEAVGLDQVIVVDLSPEHLQVSVAKVVVPGTEGYLVEGHSPGPRARAFATGKLP